ncbi:MAG: hypothetical protein MNPFHGCM_02603 [Gemmatimonadaceae bacterium]|nr:hypothetical protein [Gemmatimonadaceae bacterium]
MTSDERRGWRVGHQGRDRMYYEELHGRRWERIDIDGELLVGVAAHHVIYFETPTRWLAYPAWARDRRDEIVARITNEFRPPDYEYDGLTAPPVAPTDAAAPEGASREALPTSTVPADAESKGASPGRTSTESGPARRRGSNALLVAVLVLFALASASAWLVVSGVMSGETRLPIRRWSSRRTVARVPEPATFWLSIGVYAAVGTGALALGVLGLREIREH